MSSAGNGVVVRVFRGNDEDQFESFVNFYDDRGNMLTTKHLCSQQSRSSAEYTEDCQLLDLPSFYYYEWENIGRVVCHSDLKEICLSPHLRPRIGTIEFFDERKKELIKRSRSSVLDEDGGITSYDISKFFSMMEWEEPKTGYRKVDIDIFNPANFPIQIESNFHDKTFRSSIRFFDALGNLLDINPFKSVLEHDGEEISETWTVVDIGAFLRKYWAKVAVVECRSDLASLDRFRNVKGNIDYLIYCKGGNYRKLPEYLYKRIQPRKLEAFLQDMKEGL